MPNFDDGFAPENDNEDETFEPDIATVAFLDQQQAEFGNMEAEFEATYGFKHECHCGEDYAQGKVGEITQCYHNMMQDALATCARLNAELNEMTGIAQALYQELRDKVEEDKTADGGGTLRLVGESETDGSVSVDTESSESDDSGSSDDLAIGDSAGEGLGSTPIRARIEGGEGTPDDRKLI